ncbi:MAG: flagellar basal body P-ring formation protein FlgA [Planctomycetes bacterium]|nr:flagellar basal body P-ring formation protein FlgA [Planctomycetota bacterium]
MKAALLAGISCLLFSALPIRAQSNDRKIDGDTPKGDSRRDAQPSIRVTMRDRTSVPGLEVRLDDCVRIECSDNQLSQSLGAIPMGRTPRGTWTRSLSRNDVIEAVSSRGVKPDTIRIEGADTCEIAASVSTVTSEDLVRAAEAVLRKMLDEEGEADAEWTVQSKTRPLLIPRGRKSRRLSAEPSLGRISRGSAMIRVDILVDDEPWTAASIAFRLRRYRNVLVARKSYRRGDTLYAGDFAIERVNIAMRQDDPLSDASLIDGMVAARNLRSGETLSHRDFERPAIVHKRDNVTVVVSIGRVRVARQGIAMADGGRGDAILVQVDPKRPPISAEVAAPGLVVIARTAAPSPSDLARAADYRRQASEPRPASHR